MDDAGNGRRGLRAVWSPAVRELVRERYGIDAPDQPRDLGGSCNLNVRIADRVVRVYRPYVTPARLADINAVRAVLREGGVPCVEPIPTRDGRPSASLDGRLVEVEPFVERDAEMDSWERLEIGLPLLGRVHTLLASTTVSHDGATPPFANHVEPQDALDWTDRATQRIRRWDHPTPDELRLADLAEELARELAPAAGLPLPRQLVHGDFWDNNVFFREGRLVLVTDLDFMGVRARIDDLALTLFFTNLQFHAHPASDDHLRRLRRLVDAYDSRSGDPLTTDERAALPRAIARQPLWAAGRWLALLDDDAAARRFVAALPREVEQGLGIVRDLDRWTEAFTS